MLDEQVAVQPRELEGVGVLLDLVVEAADVLIGDVGHLLEDELFDLRAGQALEQQTGAGIHQQRVARPQLLADERRRQLDHPLLVGAAHDHRPMLVEQLLEGDDLAGQLGAPGQHNVE